MKIILSINTEAHSLQQFFFQKVGVVIVKYILYVLLIARYYV